MGADACYCTYLLKQRTTYHLAKTNAMQLGGTLSSSSQVQHAFRIIAPGRKAVTETTRCTPVPVAPHSGISWQCSAPLDYEQSQGICIKEGTHSIARYSDAL